MIVPNVINPAKKGKIEGSTFHVFFLDISTAALFDKYMDIPIIYGNKTVVKETVRNLDKHLPPETLRVRIFFYRLAPPEFKKKMEYVGLANKIVVPNY
jgi:hypothetical protein